MPLTQEFDAKAARQAGYSEDEILSHLTSSRKFDVQGAIKSGYSKSEIIDHLAATKPTPTDLGNQALAQYGLSAQPPKVQFPDVHKVDPAGGLLARGPVNLPSADRALPGSFEGKPENVAETLHDTPLLAGPAEMARQSMNAESMPPWVRNGLVPAGQAGADFIEGLSSPSTLATLGILKGVQPTSPLARTAQRGVGAYFTYQMGKGAAEGAGQAIDAAQRGDIPAAVRAGTGAAFNAAMAGDSVRGLAGSRQGAGTDLVETAKRVPGVAPLVRGTGEAVQGIKAAWNPEKNLTAEQAATKAFRPRNSKSNWKQEVQSALPDARRAIDRMGVDPENMTLEDALRATGEAKKDVWSEYVQNHLDPATAAGATVDGNVIADAILSSITPRMREQKPGLVRLIERTAGTYRGKQLSVPEAQDYLTEANGETRSIEAKYLTDKKAAKQSPSNAYKFAERDTLRSALDQTLTQVAGDGGAALRKRWGALNSMEDVVSRRLPVADRANPVSLTRILELVHGPARVVRGVLGGNVGDVAMGAFNTKQMMNAEKMNDPNWLTQQAFKKTTPTPQPAVSGEYMPEPGAYSAIVPPFARPQLGASTREYGAPENPVVDPVNNRQTGDSVTPLGATGNAGVLVRPKLLSPAPEPPVQTTPQLPWGPRQGANRALPPAGLPAEAAPQTNRVEAVGMPQSAEAAALQKAFERNPQAFRPPFAPKPEVPVVEQKAAPVQESPVAEAPKPAPKKGTTGPEFLSDLQAKKAHEATLPQALQDLHDTYQVTESHVRKSVEDAGLSFMNIEDTSASRNGLRVNIDAGTTVSVPVKAAIEGGEVLKKAVADQVESNRQNSMKEAESVKAAASPKGQGVVASEKAAAPKPKVAKRAKVAPTEASPSPSVKAPSESKTQAPWAKSKAVESEAVKPKEESTTYYHGGRDIPDNTLRRYANGGQDAGGIFLTPSKEYAKQYVKTNGGALYEAKLDKGGIFNPENPAHLDKLKEGYVKLWKDGEYATKEDALRDYRHAASANLMDWAEGGQYSDAVEAAGFRGMRFRERPGNISQNSDKSFSVSGEPIESVGLFDRELKVKRTK